MRWPWNKPREIVLGYGNVLVGSGTEKGRAFLCFVPVKAEHQIGETIPGTDYFPKLGRKDTVVWIDDVASIEVVRRHLKPQRQWRLHAVTSTD